MQNKIKSVSKRRAQELKLYRQLRRAFLKGCQCAVYPWMKATDVHHLRGRAGKLLNDVQYWIGVSRAGHNRIHSEPAWARKNGYLCGNGQWGKVN